MAENPYAHLIADLGDDPYAHLLADLAPAAPDVPAQSRAAATDALSRLPGNDPYAHLLADLAPAAPAQGAAVPQVEGYDVPDWVRELAFHDAEKITGFTNAGAAVVQGIAETLALVFKGGSLAVEGALRTAGFDTGDPREGAVYKGADLFDRAVKVLSPTNPAYDGSFAADVAPRGVGSTLAFLLTALAGSGPVAGAVAAGGAGMAVQGASGFEDALQNGASIEDAYSSFFWNLPGGALEGIPITRFLDRLDKVAGGGVKRALVNIVKGGTEEAIQEGVQGLWEYLVASDIVGYDPERQLIYPVAEGAAAGFTAGSFFNFLGELVVGSHRLARGRGAGMTTGGDSGSDGAPVPPGATETPPVDPAAGDVSRETPAAPPAEEDFAGVAAEGAQIEVTFAGETEPVRGVVRDHYDTGGMGPGVRIDLEDGSIYDGPLADIAQYRVLQGTGTRDDPVKAQTGEDVARAAENAATDATDAQKAAGNYQKGHVNAFGLDISIETPRGQARTNTDPEGEPWRVVMPAHYGYVKRTQGADGEQVDVYMGDNLDSPYAFVLDQVDADTGAFDEHKIFLGFDTVDQVSQTYEQAFSDGRAGARWGELTPMRMNEFKAWLKDGDNTVPVAYQEPETGTDAGQGTAGPETGPAVRGGDPLPFSDLTAALPGDINGDPDYVFGQSVMDEVTGETGKVWRDLTPEQQRQTLAFLRDAGKADEALSPPEEGSPETSPNLDSESDANDSNDLGGVFGNDEGEIGDNADQYPATLADDGWDFAQSFPWPQPNPDRSTILDEHRDEEGNLDEAAVAVAVRETHNETANSLLADLQDYDHLQSARRNGVDPSTGNRPRSKAAQDKLAEKIEREIGLTRRSYEDTMGAYEDVFGPDAADAFERAVRAAYQGKGELQPLHERSDIPGEDELDNAEKADLEADIAEMLADVKETGGENLTRQERALVVERGYARPREDGGLMLLPAGRRKLGEAGDQNPDKKQEPETAEKTGDGQVGKQEKRGAGQGIQPDLLGGPDVTEADMVRRDMARETLDGMRADGLSDSDIEEITEPYLYEEKDGDKLLPNITSDVYRAALKWQPELSRVSVPAGDPDAPVRKFEIRVGADVNQLVLGKPFKQQTYEDGFADEDDTPTEAFDEGDGIGDRQGDATVPAYADIQSVPNDKVSRRDIFDILASTAIGEAGAQGIDDLIERGKPNGDTAAMLDTAIANLTYLHDGSATHSALVDHLIAWWRSYTQGDKPKVTPGTKRIETELRAFLDDLDALMVRWIDQNAAQAEAAIAANLGEGERAAEGVADQESDTTDVVDQEAADGEPQEGDHLPPLSPEEQDEQAPRRAIKAWIDRHIEGGALSPVWHTAEVTDAQAGKYLRNAILHPSRGLIDQADARRLIEGKYRDDAKFGAFARSLMDPELVAANLKALEEQQKAEGVEDEAPADPVKDGIRALLRPALLRDADLMAAVEAEGHLSEANDKALMKAVRDELARALDKAEGDQIDALAKVNAHLRVIFAPNLHAMAREVAAALNGEQTDTGKKAGKKKAEAPAGPKRREKMENVGEKLEGSRKDKAQALKDRLGQAGAEASAQVDAVLKEVQRAQIWQPEAAEDATPGTQVYLELIRQYAATFLDFVAPYSGGGPRKYERTVRDTLVKIVEDEGGPRRLDYKGIEAKGIDWIVAMAAEYTALIETLRDATNGAVSAADAAAGMQEALGYRIDDNGRLRGVDSDGSESWNWQGQFKTVISDDRKLERLLRRDGIAHYDALTAEQAEAERATAVPVRRPSKGYKDIKRTGKDRRKGKDVTGDDLMTTFNFRGVEFGDWVNAEERQAMVNHAYDALHDLADLMGIAPKHIGLAGLGLAFGSRGRGGRHAAHYEPSNDVINLTKTSGDGSLAHEWLHALDWALQRSDAASKASVEVFKRRLAKTYNLDYIRNHLEQLLRGERYYEGIKRLGGVANAENYIKTGGWRKWDARSTQFRADANMMSPGSESTNYWARPHELMARAFEAWVWDSIAEQGETSDFLVNDWAEENAVSKDNGHKSWIFPRGKDRADFATMFGQLKEHLSFDENGSPRLAPSVKAVWNADITAVEAFLAEKAADLEKAFREAHDAVAKARKEAVDARDEQMGPDGRGTPQGDEPGRVSGDEGEGDAERTPAGQAGGGAGSQDGPVGEPAQDDAAGQGDRAGEPDGADPQPGRRDGDRNAVPDELGPKGQNYRITAEDGIGTGGPAAKARQNVAAIRLLKTIMGENRAATPEEQAQLVRYVGWGGLPQVFDRYTSDQNMKAIGEELRELLTEEEFREARASTKNAHYTSPQVIESIWDAARRLGFDGGRVLEPAAGVGHFLGLAPQGTARQIRATAVELDPISGQIASLLYPRHNVKVQGFETVNLPDGYFDLAVSNVPFGKYTLHDPRYNKHKLSIHNYFFVRALDLVRPGGVVAFITSRYTMDSKDRMVRRLLADKANLLGAIRLPRTAFKGNAGTEVVTDIIFLQKRRPGEKPGDAAWISTGATMVGNPDGRAEASIDVNQYFIDNPGMVLGKPSLTGSMYRDEEYTVEADAARPLEDQIADAIRGLPENVMDDDVAPEEDAEPIMAPDTVKEGQIIIDEEGKLRRRVDGVMVRYETSNNMEEQRIRGMIGVRQALRVALAAQVEGAEDWEKSLAALNKAYDAFVKKYGFVAARVNQKAFEQDPDVWLVGALENYDEDTGKATKADMLKGRVIAPRQAATHADSPSHALALSLSEKGRVDLDYMAELTGMDSERLTELLDGTIFLNPDGSRWEQAEEYLSGNVKAKLAQARAAALDDARFEGNVKALEAVQPEDVPPGEIETRMGVPWIGMEDYKAFIAHILDAHPSDVGLNHVEISNNWNISVPPAFTQSTRATAEWGAAGKNAVELMTYALQQQFPKIYKTVRLNGEEKRVEDSDATIAARAKVAEINAEFARWLWSDEQRTLRLGRIYNDEYNVYAPRKPDGSHLELPGSNPLIQLRPHQKNAVWRNITTGNTLFAHVVGAGKTFAAIAAAMEMKRLGLVRKPMFVVPNHMLEPFSRDFLQLYPGARIIAATDKAFDAKKRKKFLARVATGNWDAVIIKQSSFGQVPMSRNFEAEYLSRQIDEYRAAVSAVKAGGDSNDSKRQTVKQIETKLKNAEARLKKLLAMKKDDLVTFEELGVDYIFSDESQYFKSLSFATRMGEMPGINSSDSQRAADFHMKLQYLEGLNPGRAVTLMTATPITNSMVEAYTVQRYLQPQELRARGLENFDAWAAQFGEPVTRLEMKPDASGFRVHTRFARYRNVAQLSAMFANVVDVQTADMLNLPVPKLKGGKPEIIEIEPSEAQLDKIAELAARTEAVKSGQVDKRADNMLKISSEGRWAALDMRIVDPTAKASDSGKSAAVAGKVHEIWKRTTKQKSAQLVFLDAIAPSTKRFNVYHDMRQRMIDLGIPAGEIAFIHDHDTDARKAKLFKAVREGKVRVLFGSSEKMGVGTNVQKRLIALHHVDSPWRPSDIEQREGRIIRQGNENPEVEIYRYVTVGTFDAYMWQTVERKARFIEQFLRGQLKEAGASFDGDVGEATLSYAEVMALASGNPLVMRKAEVDAKVQELTALERAHGTKIWNLQTEQVRAEREIDRLTEYLPRLTDDLAQVKPTKGDLFTMRVGGTDYTDRTEAGNALAALVDAMAAKAAKTKTTPSGWRYNADSKRFTGTVGAIGGFPLEIETRIKTGENDKGEVVAWPYRPTAYLVGKARHGVDVEIGGTYTIAAGIGLARRLENGLERMADEVADAKSRIEQARKKLIDIKEELKKPFVQQEELDAARAEQAEIERAMAEQDGGPRRRQIEDGMSPEDVLDWSEVAAWDAPAPGRTVMTPSVTLDWDDVVRWADGVQPMDPAEPDLRWSGLDQDDVRYSLPDEDQDAEPGNATAPSGFFFGLRKAIDDLPQGKAGARQWKGTIAALRQKGIRGEEIEWTGVEDWLDTQEGTITKAEILAYVDLHEPALTEVVHGAGAIPTWPDGSRDPRTGRMVWLDDSGRFRIELEDDTGRGPRLYGLFDLFDDQLIITVDSLDKAKARASEIGRKPQYESWTLPGGEDYTELAFVYEPPAGEDGARSTRYDPPHFGILGMWGHTRFKTRTLPDGRRILAVEEFQSDQHQTGREAGYYRPEDEGKWEVVDAGDESRVALVGSFEEARDYVDRNIGYDRPELTYRLIGHDSYQVPLAPFAKTWHEFMVKRMLRWAIENGYDGLSWVSGQTQARRYNQRQRVASLEVTRAGTLMGYSKTGREVLREENITEEKAAKLVGAEVAARLFGPEGNLVIPDLSHHPLDLGEHKAALAAYNALGDTRDEALIDRVSNRLDRSIDRLTEQLHEAGWPRKLLLRYAPVYKTEHGGFVGAGYNVIERDKHGGGFTVAADLDLKAALREASQIVQGNDRELRDLDIEVGGEGMTAFYDRIVPNYAKKYVKKWGATVRPPAGHAESAALKEEMAQANEELRRLDINLDNYRIQANAAKRAGQMGTFWALTDHTAIIGRRMDELRARVNGISQSLLDVEAIEQSHLVEITPQMRESVLSGQSVFALRQTAPLGLTPRFLAAREAVHNALREEMTRLGARKMGLRVAEEIMADLPDGRRVRARGRFAANLIEVALMGDLEDMRSALRHEVIHALKTYGLFSEAEWTALERQAEKIWVAKYKTAEKYSHLSKAEQLEEAIADAFGEWRMGQSQTSSPIAALFRRIAALLEALGNALRGQGMTTWSSVFASIERGDRQIQRQLTGRQAARLAAAWHGSGVKDIARFDAGKIGTGEGATSYGWGLYFASVRAVAEAYRRAAESGRHRNSGKNARGEGWYLKTLTGEKPVLARGSLRRDAAIQFDAVMVRHFLETQTDIDTVIRMAEEQLEIEKRLDRGQGGLYARHAVEIEDDLAKLRKYRGRLVHREGTGAVYEVNLAPAEDEYLYWDKPLAQQSEKVKEALAKALDMPSVKTSTNEMAGYRIYQMMVSDRGGSKRRASLDLLAAGIPGIKYLDGASRNRPLREIKAAFLDALPEDADFEEVEGLIGTGHFTPQQDAVLAGLRDNDWLGFDHPAQAISAAYGRDSDGYDMSPELVAAIEATRDEGTYNYVIFDDSLIEITGKYALESRPQDISAGPDGRTDLFENDVEAWGKLVDRVFGGKAPSRDTTLLRRSAVLAAMNQTKDGALTITPQIAMAVRRDHPDIGRDVWERLPELVADPLYAYPYKDNTFNIVLDATTAKGELLVVGVRNGEVRTITPHHDQGQGPREYALRLVGMSRSLGNGIYVRDRNALDELQVSTREMTPQPGDRGRTTRQARAGRVTTREDVIKTQGRVFYSLADQEDAADLGVDIGAVGPAVQRDRRSMLNRLRRRLMGESALTPPGVIVERGQTDRDLNLLARFFVTPSQAFRRWPQLDRLVRRGMKAEIDQSRYINRLQGEFDDITKKLSKAEFAELGEVLFRGDAEETEYSRAELLEAGVSERAVDAYLQMRRFVDKIGRMVDMHERSMLEPVRKRKAAILTRMARMRDMDNAEFRQLYNRRSRLRQRLRSGRGDPAAIEVEIAGIEAELHAIREQIPEYIELAQEVDRLEARLSRTSIRTRTGYVPHKFFGTWRVFRLTGADPETGEPTWEHIASDQGFYPTRSDAIRGAAAYVEAHPDETLRVAPVEFKFPDSSATQLSDAAFWRFRRKVMDEMGVEGDELNELISGVARRRYRRRVAGFMQKRQGSAGYSRDLDRIMRAHIGEAVRYTMMDRLKFEAINTMEGMGLSPNRTANQQYPTLSAAVNAWWRDVNGQKQVAESQIDEMLDRPWATPLRMGLAGGAAAFLATGGITGNPLVGLFAGSYVGWRTFRALEGAGSFKTRALTGAMLGDMAHLKLGAFFNVFSALVNLTQTPLNTLPVLGPKHTMAGMKRLNAAIFSKIRGKPNNDWRILERADINPRFNFTESSPHLFQKESRLAFWSLFLFDKAETFNRGVAYLGAIDRAEAAGKTHGQAVRDAQAVITRTQFHYGPADKPEVLRNVLLRVPLQFKNFLAHQITFALGLDKKKELPLFLTSVFLMAGTLGFPGLDLLDMLLSMLFDWSPIEEIKRTSLQALGEGRMVGSIATFLSRGLPGLLGADISTRVGMGEKFLPLQTRDWQGPWWSTMETAATLGAGNATIVDQVRNLSSGLGNPLKALEAAANGQPLLGTSPERFLAALGDGEARVTNPYKRGYLEYEPTGWELILKALGGSPIREARERDFRDVTYRAVEEYRGDSASWIDRIVGAIKSGDTEQARELLVAARDDGIYLTPQQVFRSLRDANRPRTERLLRQINTSLRPEAAELLNNIAGFGA